MLQFAQIAVTWWAVFLVDPAAHSVAPAEQPVRWVSETACRGAEMERAAAAVTLGPGQRLVCMPHPPTDTNRR